MQYTVVHSNDPYLLARLATDLQMEGFIVSDWVEYADKQIFSGFNYLKIYPDLIDFFDESYSVAKEPNTKLTEANYIKVLTQILEP